MSPSTTQNNSRTEELRRLAIDTVQSAYPTPEYLKFLARLQSTELSPDLSPFRTKDDRAIDPFVSELSPDQAEMSFVERELDTQAVDAPGCRVIFGPRGCGKSALFRWASNKRGQGTQRATEGIKWLPDSVTVERVLTLSVVPSLDHSSLPSGQSELGNSQLAQSLFARYWEEAFLSGESEPSFRNEHLARLRRERSWMEQLRQYYGTFGRNYPAPDDDFELMAWLNSPSPRHNSLSQMPPDRQLAGLVQHIVSAYKVEPISEKPSSDTEASRKDRGIEFRPYKRVNILVDGLERLTPPDVFRLIRDAGLLYDFKNHGLFKDLDIKLFLDDRVFENRIKLLPAFLGQGSVPIWRIEPFSEAELLQLLRLRWSASLRRTGERISDDPEMRLGLQLGAWLAPEVRQFTGGADLLERKIIQAAQGSPRRALALARAVVTACAVWWHDSQAVPIGWQPVDEETIDQIIAACDLA